MKREGISGQNQSVFKPYEQSLPMRTPLLLLALLLVLLVSGCTQGTMYHMDSGERVEIREPTETPQVNETPEANETEPLDLCANVTCEPGTLPCPDGFEADCDNTCDNETGDCSNCTPDCSGHQDLCINITCTMSLLECPDGFLAACDNTCEPAAGNCTNCTPDCSEHLGCQPDWECTDWSRCIDGEQTRNCTDENECGTELDRPLEEQDCEVNESGHLLFSEVYYDTNGTDAEEEWLELYNPTGHSINLSGWVISDNTKGWSIPNSTTMAAHTYLTISRNSTAFYALYGCDPSLGDLTLSLSNSGDYLTLWSNESVEVDFVAWEEPEPYPDWNLTVSDGQSIKRVPPEQDTDSPEDWLSGQDPGPAC